MRHALMYQGGFESNYANLQAGATSYRDRDDQIREIPAWPAEVDGARFGYMEKPGKNFFAVRVQHGSHDVVLQNPIVIDPPRHLGYGPRLGAEPTIIQDETALELMDDIMAANPAQREELQAIRNQLPARAYRKFT